MVAQSFRRKLTVSALALVAAGATQAQDQGVTYTFYGTPGLLEMPSAVAPAEGEIAATFSGFGGVRRYNFTFQITDRLSGTFRYGSTDDYALPGFDAPADGGAYYDRSFDLRYRFMDEDPDGWRPSMVVGLQDFLGTGQYGAEYLAATKTFGDSFRLTAGLGWGRLGSYDGFTNPLGAIDASFETRPVLDFGEGGQVSSDQFFRGDAALFGGIEYAHSERLMFTAEYSSDAYVRESELGLLDRSSPLNFGVTYTPRPGVQLTAAYLHGSELAFAGSIIFNPNDRPIDSGFDTPPVPVLMRQGDAAAALTWDRDVQSDESIRQDLGRALAREGIELNAVQLTDRTARVRYTNNRYSNEAQAMGRVARILTDVLPASVEILTLEPMSRGIPMSAARMTRTDLERFEMVAGGTEAMRERIDFGDAGGSEGLVDVPPERRLNWGIAPYVQFVLFDGDNPVNLDYGVSLSASYEFSPNLRLSGSVRKSLEGGTEAGSVDPSNLEPVRTNAQQYRAQGDGGISRLQLSYFSRPGENLYGRVSVGYLETMFGGISTELLYAPVDTPWAVGAEVNYVAQRDFDLGFGFQDYDVVTGHASVYYDFDNGFHGQLDVGRYLAGDWGATLSIDREFANGWRIGGYVTLTDADPEDFGEGSFDKGIRISVPLDYFAGSPTQRSFDNTLTALNRDGGARLRVQDRLYESVRSGHMSDLDDGWGRFWR